MSQNKNIFNDISAPRVKKSSFDMGNSHVTACNFGELVPVYIQPTLPGSHWSMDHEWLVKASATLAPIMHRNQVYIHTFYVPYRNLWPNWMDFITETKTGGVLPAVPYVTVSHVSDPTTIGHVTRLLNYLGMPFPSTTPAPAFPVNIQAFWMSAYQFIWNEFYRDENLQVAMDFELIDGDNSANADLWFLKLRDWMHDYFTSALPDTQKGDPVNIPFAFGQAPVILDPDAGHGGYQQIVDSTGNPFVSAGLGSDPGNAALQDQASGDTVWVDPFPSMIADLTGVGSTANIIDLRTAEQLQKFRETMMTHGSRYNEFLQAIYGYKINDATIQRPVYLGGMRGDLIVSETLATTNYPAADQPQGAKSGNLNAYAQGGKISYTCPEHGVVMSLMSVMPDSAYFQGIPKEMVKLNDPFEFGNPLMANIGEQPIIVQELIGFQASPETVFGYQSRYAEYKQTFNRISSEMSTSLFFWNMARYFGSVPQLNSDFVECNAANDSLNRIFNVEDASVLKLWIMVRTNAHVNQPLPYFGTPMLGG